MNADYTAKVLELLAGAVIDLADCMGADAQEQRRAAIIADVLLRLARGEEMNQWDELAIWGTVGAAAGSHGDTYKVSRLDTIG